MHFTVHINVDNDAFEGTAMRGELVRILLQLAARIEGGMGIEGKIRDVNGNTVGEHKLA